MVVQLQGCLWLGRALNAVTELTTEAELTTDCCYPAKDVTADIHSEKLESLTFVVSFTESSVHCLHGPFKVSL